MSTKFGSNIKKKMNKFIHDIWWFIHGLIKGGDKVNEFLGFILVGLIVVVAIGVISGLTWLAFFLAHIAIPIIPVLTFWQAVCMGLALSIVGGFFKNAQK